MLYVLKCILKICCYIDIAYANFDKFGFGQIYMYDVRNMYGKYVLFVPLKGKK